MAVPDSWDQLRTEYDQLKDDPDYASLRPLLDRALAYINVSESPEIVKVLLEIARAFHEEARPGSKGAGFLREVAEGIVNKGFFNEGLDAKGSIIQTQGNVILNLVEESARELKIPEPGVEVGVVLVAMTSKEAQSLFDGTVFTPQVEVLKQNFESLAGYLKQLGVANWVSHYDATPEQWRPHGGPTIGELIIDEFTELNEDKEFPEQLVAKFYDIRALDSTRRNGRRLLRRLRGSGCLVIVDAISIRHPALLRAYQRSLLDVFPSISVVTLTPDGNAFQFMKSMVYALQTSLEESEFNLRMEDPWDGMACQTYSSPKQMSRWLVERVRKISETTASKGGIRAQMHT